MSAIYFGLKTVFHVVVSRLIISQGHIQTVYDDNKIAIILDWCVAAHTKEVTDSFGVAEFICLRWLVLAHKQFPYSRRHLPERLSNTKTITIKRKMYK
jgi:hypothetical protein